MCYRNRPVWIGLHKSALAKTDNCYWVDGNPSRYRNWQGSEPNSKNDRCVSMVANGRHCDKRCSKTYRYVCKKENGISVFTRAIYLHINKTKQNFEQSKPLFLRWIFRRKKRCFVTTLSPSKCTVMHIGPRRSNQAYTFPILHTSSTAKYSLWLTVLLIWVLCMIIIYRSLLTSIKLSITLPEGPT